MLPANIHNLLAGLCQLQDPEDLLLGESALAHESSSFPSEDLTRRFSFQLDQFFWGQVTLVVVFAHGAAPSTAEAHRFVEEALDRAKGLTSTLAEGYIRLCVAVSYPQHPQLNKENHRYATWQ